MRSTELWSGELMLRRARPHALAWGDRYLFGLTFIAAAVAIVLATRGAWWADFADMLFARWLVPAGLHAVALLTFSLVGTLGARFVRRDAAFALSLFGWAVGVAGSILLQLWSPVPEFGAASFFVPAYLAALGVGALAVAEAKRRATVLTVTSRRLLLDEGVWRRRTRTMALEAVTGIEWSEPLVGRLFGYATLHVSSEVLRTRRGTRKGKLAKATDESLSETNWVLHGAHPQAALRRDLDRVLTLASEEDDLEERELVLKVLDTLPEVSRFASEHPMRASVA
jgi:hypothetical protein